MKPKLRTTRMYPSEPLDLSVLPDNAQAELYDFYLFLKQRYGKPAQTIVSNNSKLAALPKRACIKGDPEDLVHCDWSGEWRE